MDSCNSGSLQSSSGGEEEDQESNSSIPTNHSSFFLPPFSPFLDQTLNFVIPNPLPPPLPPPPSSSKNPKKRSRASRRAPTTILTTDTSNFRSMVQEFTGIPSSPFSSTRRFDIFRSSSSSHQISPLNYNPFRSNPLKLHTSTSMPAMNFPSLPNLPLNQVSTFDRSLLSNPTDQNNLMMAHFGHGLTSTSPDFDHRPEKVPVIINNVSSSGTTTTTTVDPWIFPADSNN